MGVGLQQHPARQLASVAAHAFMDAAVLFLQWKQWENVGLFCCHAVALSCPITQQCKRGGIPQFLHFFFYLFSTPNFLFHSQSLSETNAGETRQLGQPPAIKLLCPCWDSGTNGSYFNSDTNKSLHIHPRPQPHLHPNEVRVDFPPLSLLVSMLADQETQWPTQLYNEIQAVIRMGRHFNQGYTVFVVWCSQ